MLGVGIENQPAVFAGARPNAVVVALAQKSENKKTKKQQSENRCAVAFGEVLGSSS